MDRFVLSLCEELTGIVNGANVTEIQGIGNELTRWRARERQKGFDARRTVVRL